MRISILPTERTHSSARTPSVTDGGPPQSTVSCASTVPETEHPAAHSRAIDALGFRRTLQAPLAELRSRDTARASALQQAFGIVDRTSFAERSRSVHLSAYVKACFGLCSESSDREFRAFQALALELSRNTGPRWRHRTVTRSSVDLAVRLYVNVVGPDHAFANGALERTGFIGFLARHTGIDARTLATAIGRDYLRSVRLVESRDRLNGNPESQPLTGRVVRLNGAAVPIDAPRAHVPTLTSQLWRHIARFVSQEDIPSLSAIDSTARTTFAQTAREIRLFSRAKQTSSLADVRWILDPLFQPDDARHEAIRDASADTRTGLLRVLAARLVAIDDRHDALQAWGCGQILKKANELIKKGMGINPQLLSNREKAKLVDALKQTYALPELLAALGLARSSYFYHRARLLVADRHADARRVIADIFELNHRCYGYRRIRAALIRQRVFISEKVVRRLMRQEGLAAATTR